MANITNKINLLLKIGFQEVSTLQKAKDLVKETTAKTLNRVTEVTNTAISSVSQTVTEVTEKAKNSLSIASAKATDTIAENTTKAVYNAHPAVASTINILLWITHHPIFSVIILVLAILISWQLFKIASRLVEQALLLILKTPFNIGKLLWNQSFKALNKPANSNFINQTKANILALNASNPTLVDSNSKERIVKILTKLESIQAEQNELLQELSTILTSKEPSAEQKFPQNHQPH